MGVPPPRWALRSRVALYEATVVQPGHPAAGGGDGGDGTDGDGWLGAVAHNPGCPPVAWSTKARQPTGLLPRRSRSCTAWLMQGTVRALGVSPAQQRHAGDGVQRPLRSRFPPRLMPGVRLK